MIGFALVVFISSFLLAAIATVIAARVFERNRQAAGGPSPTAEFDDSPTILKVGIADFSTPR